MTIKVSRRQFEFDADGNIVEQPKTIEEQRADLMHSIRYCEEFLSQKYITEEARASTAKRLTEAKAQLAELNTEAA